MSVLERFEMRIGWHHYGIPGNYRRRIVIEFWETRLTRYVQIAIWCWHRVEIVARDTATFEKRIYASSY